jgi:iron(III) transport system substrate-binding protein
VSNISRRAFLGGTVAWGAMLLAGCGQSATPSSQTGTAGAATSAAAGSTGPAAEDWQIRWNSLVDAAKKEGAVTVHFAAGGGPPARATLPPIMKNQFGIDMEVIVQPTAEFVSKLQLEQSAGQHTVDVVVSGANTMYGDMYGAKMFQPLRPQLFRPDVTNPADWTVGKMWFMDPEEQYILRIANAATGWVAINTSIVKEGELTSWKDLLKPQYKGKIATFDPTINGQGGQHAAYLDLKFGTDFVKQLYQGQAPLITRDNSQFGDWLGRGNAGIGVSMDSSTLEKLKKDGLPVTTIQPPFSDGPGYLTGNTGLIGLLNNPPHPAAAQLFCNWLASPAGLSVYDKAINYVAPLKTVKSDWVSDYQTPKPGLDYIDTYDWTYALQTYPQHFNNVRKALGAS